MDRICNKDIEERFEIINGCKRGRERFKYQKIIVMDFKDDIVKVKLIYLSQKIE